MVVGGGGGGGGGVILGEVKARPKDIISFSLDYISKSKVQTSNPSSSPISLDTPARPADFQAASRKRTPFQSHRLCKFRAYWRVSSVSRQSYESSFIGVMPLYEFGLWFLSEGGWGVGVITFL